MPTAQLRGIVEEAHEKVCPYSHATRGNIPFELEVVAPDLRGAHPDSQAAPVRRSREQSKQLSASLRFCDATPSKSLIAVKMRHG